MSIIRVSNFRLILSDEDKRFILEKTREVLSSDRWTSGAMGNAFEETFKTFTGAHAAAAVSNGGVALIALLQALNVKEGSIIICPTLTAPPTPHAILASGMKVLFADSDPVDLGLDPADVEAKIRCYAGKVGAVIAVHVGGWISPKISLLADICRRYGVPLIEDCAHAHGSKLHGKHAGSTAGVAAYSFFMTKSLTSGEGGIVTAEDAALVEKIKIIRNYGKNGEGKHVMKGFNYKLSEFDAVVALWAAVHAPRLIADRRRIAAAYDNLLAGIEGLSVLNVPGCHSGYYKYIVMLDPAIDRDRVKKLLLEKYGVEASGGVYDTLCHQEEFFHSVPDKVINASEVFAQAERFSSQQLCLPLYPGLSEEDQHHVAASVAKALADGVFVGK